MKTKFSRAKLAVRAFNMFDTLKHCFGSWKSYHIEYKKLSPDLKLIEKCNDYVNDDYVFYPN